MSFPPFILLCLTVLTQLCNQLLTRVISSYICTLKTHNCTRYLTRRVICPLLALNHTRAYSIFQSQKGLSGNVFAIFSKFDKVLEYVNRVNMP